MGKMKSYFLWHQQTRCTALINSTFKKFPRLEKLCGYKETLCGHTPVERNIHVEIGIHAEVNANPIGLCLSS